MNFKILKFDSELFGFKVAKILVARLSVTKLKPLLQQLQKKEVRLVYWPAASTDSKSQLAAKTLNGFLSSYQITYTLSLKKVKRPVINSPEIKIYQDQSPSLAMKKLAWQIGKNSRFWLDQKLRPFMTKMYNSWIINSVNGSAADQVLVAYQRKKVIGMITLGKKNRRGDIGLLAVDQKFRGKNLGTKLVMAAQAYFIKQGLSQAQVVTQKTNLAACALYEKTGFHQEKIENFYHFWL